MSKPGAGEGIASRCTVVILGNNKPLFVELISSLAEGEGVAVPIPTPCEKAIILNAQIARVNDSFFIKLILHLKLIRIFLSSRFKTDY
jgi:hypothetical protein